MMPVRFFFLSLLILHAVSIYGQHITIETKKQAGRFLFSLPFSSTSSALKKSALQIEADGPIEGMRDKKVIFKSTVKKNKLDGKWISYHANGQMLDSGYLVKGIPNGIWKVWDSDGNLIKIREYDADLYQRIIADIDLNHPRSVKFAITTRYRKEGNAIFKNLTSSYSFNGADISKHNKLEDLVKENSENTQAYHPVFIACAHSGEYVNFSEPGIIRDSGYYKNGLKEGYWIHRDHSNTFTEKGSYKNGLKIDIWKKEDISGKLISLKYYDQEGRLKWEKQR